MREGLLVASTFARYPEIEHELQEDLTVFEDRDRLEPEGGLALGDAKSRAEPSELNIPEPKKLTIVLPALNEEEGIRRVMPSLPIEKLRAKGLHPSVLVVDGHSTDNTCGLAASFGAQIVAQDGWGKGNAVRTVIRGLSGDYMIMMDADNTYPADILPEIVDLLEKGYDCITGSRLRGQIHENAMSKMNLLGNRLLTGIANILYGAPYISDVCTGFWAFRVDAVKRMNLTADGFDIEADLYTEAVRLGLRYTEIPIVYRAREGESKLRLRSGGMIALRLLRNRLRQLGVRVIGIARRRPTN